VGGGRPSLEVHSKSGRVTIRADATATAVEVAKGAAEFGADGVLRGQSGQNIEIVCPEDTDVIIGTKSGSVRCTGRLGRVAVTTMSGSVAIEQAHEVDVRADSGSVKVGMCETGCRIAHVSGRVEVDRATSVKVAAMSSSCVIRSTRDAWVKSASGKVHIGADAGGRIEVRALSGSVEIEVPDVATPTTRLNSHGGRVRCDCPQGTDGSIDVETLSGAISVTCH
jgi:DUF4097 and DUF4098 domain-containing protein YvlB